ncbi:MAG TPA: hypothetical protein VHL11_23375 [Phototrophicaceae bacterium]|nr:hypothetical protein [Phototrophicaceae bacterium]
MILFWIIVTPILLEVGMRLLAPYLPPALQLAAERAEKGQALDINRLQLMTMDIDHNFMMRPNVDNALYGPKETVVFHVTTTQILDSRMGFRTYPVKQGDKIDVAVVGDSFSFCFTEFVDCWVTRFEQATGLRTMNLAQGSTGSMSHWRFVDTFGRAFQPPLVIWQWFGNDFNEDYQLALTRGETASLGDTVVPDYHKNDAPVLRWLRSNSVAWVVIETALFGEDAYISDFERYHFTPEGEVQFNGHTLEYGQKYEQIAMNMSDPRVSYGISTTREALLNSRQAVESWGGKFVVFLIPVREEVYSDLIAPKLGADQMAIYSGARETMLGLCDELQLTCYDLLPDLQTYARQGDLLYYPDDMHLNPHGNVVVEELIQKWLDGLGFLNK